MHLLEDLTSAVCSPFKSPQRNIFMSHRNSSELRHISLAIFVEEYHKGHQNWVVRAEPSFSGLRTP